MSAIFELGVGGFFEVTEGETSPTVVDIRRKLNGFKAIQVTEDFTVRIGARTYTGHVDDWIVFNPVSQKLQIVDDVRFQKLYEVAP